MSDQTTTEVVESEPVDVRSAHYHEATDILEALGAMPNSPYEWRIARAQVHALLELAAAIRSLDC